jgi:hypothetical protein
MKREKLFNVVKTSQLTTKTFTSVFAGIENKIPTFFRTDFKKLVSNSILLKIIKKFIENSEFVSEEVKTILNSIISETTKDPIVIGVAGMCGKTTTCEVLYKYLTNLGNKVVLYDSINQINPILKSFTSLKKTYSLIDNDQFISALNLALIYNPDYIIVELHERDLQRNRRTGIYNISNIPFDYLLWTSYDCAFYQTEPYYTDDQFFEDVKTLLIPTEETKVIMCTSCVVYNDISKDSYRFINYFKDNKDIKFCGTYGFISTTEEERTAEKAWLNTRNDSIEVNTWDSSTIISDNDGSYKFTTKLPWENLKSTTVIISLLKDLNIFDYDKLNTLYSSLETETEKILTIKNRGHVIISDKPFYAKLENFIISSDEPDLTITCTKVKFPNRTDINNLYILHSLPFGYNRSWDSIMTEEEYDDSNERNFDVRKSLWDNNLFDANNNLLVNKIYVAPNNPGECDPAKMCEDTLKVFKADERLTDDLFESYTIREDAIKAAVSKLQENDLLIIGSRGVFAAYSYLNEYNELTARFFTDESVVREAVKELGWEIEE